MEYPIKNYRLKPDDVEAAQLTRENAYTIARWCGGEVVEEEKPGDPSDVSVSLRIPTLYGPEIALVGNFVVQSKESGRFNVRIPAPFLANYEES